MTSDESMSDASLSAKRDWPAIAALFTAGLLPATTARRTDHVSLREAHALHWLAMLLAAGLLLPLFGWSAAIDRRHDWNQTLAETANLSCEIIEEFVQDPVRATAVTAGIVLGVELTFVVLALLVTPWGARDEPMRASIASALRRTWVHTPHLLPAMLLVGVSLNGVRQGKEDWLRRNPAPPSVPLGRINLLGFGRRHPLSPQAVAEMRRRRLEWNQSRPWYVKYADEATGYGCFGALTWFLWGLFRSVGAQRETPRVDRPPTCEACGYNLTSAAMEGRCPECGEPVARSLGPDARPGTPWDRRRELGRWRAWWQSVVGSVVRPRSFGAQIRRSAPEMSHRRFLALHLPVFFLMGAVAVVSCHVAATGRNPYSSDPYVVSFVGPLVGCVTAAFVIVCALGSAWFVALCYRARGDASLLSGAMQMASYLSGYVVFWALFETMICVHVFALARWFLLAGQRYRVDSGMLMFLACLLPSLLWLVGYVVLVRRGAAGVRFANR